VRRIEGTPIPTDWPAPKVNGKFRTSAAVETARSLIRVVDLGGSPRPQKSSFSRKSLQNLDPASEIEPPVAAQNQQSSRVNSHRQHPEKNFCVSRVTLEDTPPSRAIHRDQTQEKISAKTYGVQMIKNKKSVAVETARATIKTNGGKKPPVVFTECHDDPQMEVSTSRKGATRKQPPAHLRKAMPEHSDEAYYAAQAALRAGGPEPINEDVPPSDYHRGGPRLKPDELQQIVALYTEKYGPILSLDEAAEITKFAKQTLRRYVCEEKFASSVFRGRPLRFITQRLIEEVLG
jgi:hypothetical protein